jgi:hypothetical protein
MSLFESLVSVAVKKVNMVNSFEFVKNNPPNEIGVYIMKLNGKVMYVGIAYRELRRTWYPRPS